MARVMFNIMGIVLAIDSFIPEYKIARKKLAW